MSNDCFGPAPDWRKCKFGECRECFDTNWSHRHHVYFDGRQHMIGKPCGHRLAPVAHKPKQFKFNRINDALRQKPEYQDPDYRRALLPEYCAT